MGRAIASLWVAAALGPAALPSSALAEARQYRLSGDNARLTFEATAAGIVGIDGAFTRFDGAILIDEARPGEGRIAVTVDATSLVTNDPDWAGDAAGPDFFDVARHPTFAFASTEIALVEPGRLRIDGVLTLRGVAAYVTLDALYAVERIGEARVARIDATGEIDRGTFGMDAYPLFVDDEVEIRIAGRLVDRGEASAPR